MSLRGLWILYGASGDLLFSRRYETVERRHKIESGETYRELPSDAQLVATYQAACAPHLTRPPFIQSLASAWPVVSLPEDPLVYLCIPSVVTHGKPETLMVDAPVISASAVLLRQISVFMRPPPASPTGEPAPSHAERAADLNVHLAYCVPFGRLVDTNLALMRSQLRKEPDRTPLTQKQPAWLPTVLHNARPLVTLTIREEVRALQYDSDDISDVVEAHGQVMCKAELNGVNDVTLSFSGAAAVADVRVHACAQAEEDFDASSAVVFSPPLEVFPLLSYRIPSIPKPPVRGFYQMKMVDTRTVQILIQLKLADYMSSDFDFCQVLIPFSHRGLIASADVKPTAGVVHVVPSQPSLIWNIGQRFTGKGREVALPGTITFAPLGAPEDLHENQGQNQGHGVQIQPQSQGKSLGEERFSYEADDNNDPFCVDHNSYVRLRFKMQETSLSGLNVSPGSLIVYPSEDAKLNVVREVYSESYVIWNSLGDARAAASGLPIE